MPDVVSETIEKVEPLYTPLLHAFYDLLNKYHSLPILIWYTSEPVETIFVEKENEAVGVRYYACNLDEVKILYRVIDNMFGVNSNG